MKLRVDHKYQFSKAGDVNLLLFPFTDYHFISSFYFLFGLPVMCGLVAL